MITVDLHHASMLDWLDAYDGPLFDSCVTDPPYHLIAKANAFGPGQFEKQKGKKAPSPRGFMGKEWDGGDIAFDPETWRRVYDALKPGAHLVAFSGTRTYHRMACAIEDAGFEIRDQLKYDFATGTLIDSFWESLTPAQADVFARIMDALAPGQLAWEYGSGFPKSHDVSKAIDKAAGVVFEAKPAAGVGFMGPDGPGGYNVTKNQLSRKGESTPDAQKWQGWGSALKPSWEPICLARKPLAEKNIAANVLAHGTGAINVDACRVGTSGGGNSCPGGAACKCFDRNAVLGATKHPVRAEGIFGRFPANLCHDGSEEVLAGFPAECGANGGQGQFKQHTWAGQSETAQDIARDKGSAARFFYSAKAGPLDRIGTAHATVKPVDLMRWLCRLVTPPGGHILEPFAGSGTTGIAAMAEGFDCTMIELEAEHVADIERKLAYLRGEGGAGVIERHKARIDRGKGKADDCGPLFGGPR